MSRSLDEGLNLKYKTLGNGAHAHTVNVAIYWQELWAGKIRGFGRGTKNVEALHQLEAEMRAALLTKNFNRLQCAINIIYDKVYEPSRRQKLSKKSR